MLAAAKTDSGTLAVGGEVAHGCPRFQVWSRDGYVTIYEQGRVGDGLARHASRRDHQDGARMQDRAGPRHREIRLLGPRAAGAEGQVRTGALPVTVFVTDAKREKMATDKVKVDVDVALDKPIGYFSIVRSVTFNIPEGSRPGEFEVYVGFDRNIPGAG